MENYQGESVEGYLAVRGIAHQIEQIKEVTIIRDFELMSIGICQVPNCDSRIQKVRLG